MKFSINLREPDYSYQIGGEHVRPISVIEREARADTRRFYAMGGLVALVALVIVQFAI